MTRKHLSCLLFVLALFLMDCTTVKLTDNSPGYKYAAIKNSRVAFARPIIAGKTGVKKTGDVSAMETVFYREIKYRIGRNNLGWVPLSASLQQELVNSFSRTNPFLTHEYLRILKLQRIRFLFVVYDVWVNETDGAKSDSVYSMAAPDPRHIDLGRPWRTEASPADTTIVKKKGEENESLFEGNLSLKSVIWDLESNKSVFDVELSRESKKNDNIKKLTKALFAKIK